MLRILTSTMRRRAAGAIALAYLACVIWPPLALAFADGAVAAHCLTDDQQISHPIAATVHVHQDGTVREHHPTGGSDHQPVHSDGKGTTGNCCGLFSLNAMAPAVSMPVGPPQRGFAFHPAVASALAEHGPARLYRPPNDLTSL